MSEQAHPRSAEPGTTTAPTAEPGSLRLRIPAMDCAAEESEIRRVLEPLPGIQGLRFQLGQRSLEITGAAEALAQAPGLLAQAGFAAETLDIGSAPASTRPGGLPRGLPPLLLALALATAAELTGWLAPAGALTTGAEMSLAALAIWLAGLETYRKGLSALRHGRLNITALMTVAVSGAFLIGQWPEAAMVMALYALAERIEAGALDRARNAIQGLMALAPAVAQLRQADGSWQTVAAAEVALGAVLRIRPGERLPLDGVVTLGSSAIDQSPITGESIPVDKTVGDPVFAGTINQSAELEIRVSAIGGDTTLARIIHAVETAQGSRAPTQRFVDRFAAIYTPAVFLIALAVALLAPLALGWSWSAALYKALVLLVIACPCALVISTPVTVVSALATAARRGILIKGGSYIEEARRLKAVALDKTGTITEGQPRLAEFLPLADDADLPRLRQLAASLAGRSDHPVSQAIARGLGLGGLAVEGFTALPGRGVRGHIDGVDYVLGNHRLIEERRQCSEALEQRLAVQEAQGRTVTLLASEAGVLALMSVADTIKETSREAVGELLALGITPVMLSGDNGATARSIADQAGIGDARGDLLPEDKLAAITALRAQYGLTAMVGDGINDAPALAQADIGIAMGTGGTDTAMEAADIVIMNDDLRGIASAVRLSRRTHAVLWQNISLALGIKAVFLVLALEGSATMWMAVFADMGASLLVVANGLRLLRSGARERR